MFEQNKTARPRGTDSAKVIQVIETRALIGLGTQDDPCRLLIQHWSFGGHLLASKDSFIHSSELQAGEQQASLFRQS